MPIEILMPALSPTMTEGALVRWLKQEGDKVKAGQVIAEIETDKATMEVEAVDEGTIGKILIAAGTQGVKVNTPIALLLEDGEGPLADAPPAKSKASVQVETAKESRVMASIAPTAHVSDERIAASPLARRVAEQAGIDLSFVRGTGPNGRIILADVEQFISSGKGGSMKPAAAPMASSASAVPPPPASKASSGGVFSQIRALVSPPTGAAVKAAADQSGQAYTAIPNSGVRKVIARRLTESKQNIPHFYLTIDCELDELQKLRHSMNTSYGAKISVNDCIIRAAALALKKVPAANASWTDEAVLQYAQSDVSVAVSTNGGLMTPIVRQAESKSLMDISTEMKELASRARDGKLRPDEFQGGSFTISNLGMFGIKSFHAIINPPQACILAVGAAEQRPLVKDGKVTVATVMTCTLSVDHRAIDGAVGAEFLGIFKALIEHPYSLVF